MHPQNITPPPPNLTVEVMQLLWYFSWVHLQTCSPPSGLFIQNLDSPVKTTYFHSMSNHFLCSRHQTRRALAWDSVKKGFLHLKQLAQPRLFRYFPMVLVEIGIPTVVQNSPVMSERVTSRLILVRRTKEHSSRSVSIFGRPEQYWGWGDPVLLNWFIISYIVEVRWPRYWAISQPLTPHLYAPIISLRWSFVSSLRGVSFSLPDIIKDNKKAFEWCDLAINLLCEI